MTERQKRALLRAAIARELVEKEMERVTGGDDRANELYQVKLAHRALFSFSSALLSTDEESHKRYKKFNDLKARYDEKYGQGAYDNDVGVLYNYKSVPFTFERST